MVNRQSGISKSNKSFNHINPGSDNDKKLFSKLRGAVIGKIKHIAS